MPPRADEQRSALEERVYLNQQFNDTRNAVIMDVMHGIQGNMVIMKYLADQQEALKRLQADLDALRRDVQAILALLRDDEQSN